MRIKITLKQFKKVLTKAELKFPIIFQVGIIDKYEIAELLKKYQSSFKSNDKSSMNLDG